LLRCYHTIELGDDEGRLLAPVIRKDCSHVISAIVLAIALYSASVEDLDTVACFLELQDIRLEPKKTHNPPVDRLSSGQPAQSELEKACKLVDESFRIKSPRDNVCCR
jgi:hypothetical protein